jgi:fatty acid CoA ligase FadD9
MSTDSREDRLARRVADLYSTDIQFADARPIEALTAAIEQPGLRLSRIMSTVMGAYAERPAVGERAVNLTTDPATGRTSLELLPWFQTITYRELWERVGAVASGLTEGPGPVQPGDRVCVLGFASADYATIDMALMLLGAVSVPLQTSAPVSQLRPIVTETEPRVFGSSIGDLADAVELVLTGYTPARLVVFDYRPDVDDLREAFDAAKTRLAEAGSPVLVETLDALLDRGASLPAAPEFVPDDDEDPLRLLIYTSGSTGAPKGAMYPERLVANFWRRSRWNWGSSVEPLITLSFMPMSHVMGRGILYGTLGQGGTAYFTARSDLRRCSRTSRWCGPPNSISCRGSGTCCSPSSRARWTDGPSKAPIVRYSKPR